MDIKRDKRIGLMIALAALAIVRLFYATVSFSSGVARGVGYFKGSWTVTMRNNPKEIFNWRVKEELGGSWMTGVVEKNGVKVSTDFWRQKGDRIERFAFTADGLFVRIESEGWDADQLVMTGVASDKNGETKIRETIRKVNDRQFSALWEREGSDGKWVTFADEICTK